ncbi:hypothetical protein [Foetidibacter luteolus]|uniref:hypothetical protein n=1 Tax=Foetidibacter luteolus TaxID=2608880 RepID=UPI00129B59ED|nr:hypothetical protein [Foetidibacter luteolus]
MLLLFLFNLVGYRLFFYAAQRQSDIQLELALDKEAYNESDLVTVTIPLSNPYQVSRPDFERVDGEINLNGVLYKYVKRKVFNGELVLLCLPNHQKMRLLTAKNDFIKYSSDINQPTENKKSDNSKSNAFKNLLSEFETGNQLSTVQVLKINSSCPPANKNEALASAPHLSPEQPPEVA